MGLVSVDEKVILGRCAMCGGKLERANLGYLCNTCRDGMRQKK